MDQNLQNLYHQKEALKERIKISEIGNDSYDLSFERQIYEEELFKINQKIKQAENLLSYDKKESPCAQP